MTAVSPSLAPFELEDAVAIARGIGAKHELVDSNEIENESYAKNDVDRCFHCKSELYRISSKKHVEWGLAHVVNGTNLDDLGDYRPGLEAAKDAGARSPLVEASSRKPTSASSRTAIGLGVWDKPAAACLSSRLPYGTRVTRERLAQIGSLEAELHALGIRQARVRWHASKAETPLDATREVPIARIEVASDEMMKAFDAQRRDRRSRQAPWLRVRHARSRRLPHRQPQRSAETPIPLRHQLTARRSRLTDAADASSVRPFGTIGTRASGFGCDLRNCTGLRRLSGPPPPPARSMRAK